MTNLLLACLSFFAKEVFASLVLSDYTGASCQWWTGDVAHHPELAPLDSESYGHGDSTGSLPTMASPTKSSGCGGLLDRLRRKASNWYLGKWATKPAHHWHFHGCMVWRHICILAGQDWFECFGRPCPREMFGLKISTQYVSHLVVYIYIYSGFNIA